MIEYITKVPRGFPKISATAVRDAIQHFLDHGKSGPHSKFGQLLVPILNHCEANDIPYQLSAYPKGGYMLQRMTIDQPPLNESVHQPTAAGTLPAWQGSRTPFVPVGVETGRFLSTNVRAVQRDDPPEGRASPPSGGADGC